MTIFLSPAGSAARSRENICALSRESGIALVNQNFLDSCNDGFERRTRRRSSASRSGQQSRISGSTSIACLSIAGVKIDNAISDGEDYELLFAISPRDRDRLEKSWRKKISEIAAHAHRFPQSTIGKSQSVGPSAIRRWLRSFHNSPAETEEFGRRLCQGNRARIGACLERRSRRRQNAICQRPRRRRWEAALPLHQSHIHDYSRISGWTSRRIYHFDFFRLEDRQSAAASAWMIIFSAMASP